MTMFLNLHSKKYSLQNPFRDQWLGNLKQVLFTPNVVLSMIRALNLPISYLLNN